jgi:hypothetical protein
MRDELDVSGFATSVSDLEYSEKHDETCENDGHTSWSTFIYFGVRAFY